MYIQRCLNLKRGEHKEERELERREERRKEKGTAERPKGKKHVLYLPPSLFFPLSSLPLFPSPSSTCSTVSAVSVSSLYAYFLRWKKRNSGGKGGGAEGRVTWVPLSSFFFFVVLCVDQREGKDCSGAVDHKQCRRKMSSQIW